MYKAVCFRKDLHSDPRIHTNFIETKQGISTVAEDTPLPFIMDTFWTSFSITTKQQALLRKYVIDKRTIDLRYAHLRFCL